MIFLKARNLLISIFLIASATYTHGQTSSGNQIINGTEVFTEVFENDGYARFSNACGSQTISQTALQQGAIPNNIIPCPRGGNRSGGLTCPPDHTLHNNGRCYPDGAVPCGNSGIYCEAGNICTKENRCLAIASDRVCGDLKSYCSEGYECLGDECKLDCPLGEVGSKTGECIPDDATDCGDGNYCGSNEICVSGGECLAWESDRVCASGAYCGEEKVCKTDDNDKDICVAKENPDETVQEETYYVALVATPGLKFFGTAMARTKSYALEMAKSICRSARDNTYSTTDEHALTCDIDVVISNGCVALSRSSEIVYGSEPTYVGGMSTDIDRQKAIDESMGYCKTKGGGNCFVVPESVRCAPG